MLRRWARNNRAALAWDLDAGKLQVAARGAAGGDPLGAARPRLADAGTLRPLA